DIYHYKRYATFIPRFWAPFIDTVILWPFGMVLRLVLHNFSVEDDVVRMFANNIVAFIYPCYSIYFHGRYDATLGKMACKIKVLSARRETSISITRAFFRDFIPVATMAGIFSWVLWADRPETAINSVAFYAIPVIYYVWLLLELITMLTNRRGRAVQDYFAGTVVVRAD
ncbi:MAG: RDD family protein, partial [Verrucomicrobiae bacterium]|nr:RDD family protein [Verrucomicrobiae bacterium]